MSFRYSFDSQPSAHELQRLGEAGGELLEVLFVQKNLVAFVLDPAGGYFLSQFGYSQKIIVCARGLHIQKVGAVARLYHLGEDRIAETFVYFASFEFRS